MRAPENLCFIRFSEPSSLFHFLFFVCFLFSFFSCCLLFFHVFFVFFRFSSLRGCGDGHPLLVEEEEIKYLNLKKTEGAVATCIPTILLGGAGDVATSILFILL